VKRTLRPTHPLGRVQSQRIGWYKAYRLPYALYRPVNYRDYDPLVKFEPVIDAYLNKLFAQEDVIDEANKDIADPMVNDVAESAIQDLARQRVDHTNQIHNFYRRRTADRLEIAKQLEKLQATRAESEEELADINARFNVNRYGG